jgi:hypothetical protein
LVDTDSSNRPDRRPVIAICVWNPSYPTWDLVEDLSGEPWSPPGARTQPISGDADGEALAERLIAALKARNCGALLLIGRTIHSGDFRLQMRAENRRLDGSGRLDETGPGVARVTAPIAEMSRELTAAGLSVLAASDAEDDQGSYILYRVLADLPDNLNSPSIGLLRIPDEATEDAVRTAIKTTASAMARHLTPLPRSSAA